MKNNGNKSISPFLKWAGGKRWLVASHKEVFNLQFDRYFEPFLGAGAVFFSIRPKTALLSDTNRSLIETYIAIRDKWQDVTTELKKHAKLHSREHYYKTRNTTFESKEKAAAQFIYLNRACWNGLYRVNLNGKFNVPIGSKLLIPAEDYELKYVSEILQNTDIVACDFETRINKAKYGDLVFADPPYTIKHNTNSFIKYNEKLFSWGDQVRLSKCLMNAKLRGAQVVATNANHEAVRKLYNKEFELKVVSRNSLMSASKATRGRFEELIIS